MQLYRFEHTSIAQRWTLVLLVIALLCSAIVSSLRQPQYLLAAPIEAGTEPIDDCNEDDEDDDDDEDEDGECDESENEFYGVVNSFPSGLVGTWTINGMTFVATASTKFEQEDGVFAVGVTVEVEYVLENDGTKRAIEIESEDQQHDDDHDDDGELEAYGRINSRPAGNTLIGNWTIDGVLYQATSNTQFETEHGGFVVGTCVEVEYIGTAAPFTATKLETESDHHCRETGIIQQMGNLQAAGIANEATWVIGNVGYVVTEQTQLDESNGGLAVGQFASVDSYVASDGRLTASIIQSITLENQLFLPIIE